MDLCASFGWPEPLHLCEQGQEVLHLRKTRIKPQHQQIAFRLADLGYIQQSYTKCDESTGFVNVLLKDLQYCVPLLSCFPDSGRSSRDEQLFGFWKCKKTVKSEKKEIVAIK